MSGIKASNSQVFIFVLSMCCDSDIVTEDATIILRRKLALPTKEVTEFSLRFTENGLISILLPTNMAAEI